MRLRFAEKTNFPAAAKHNPDTIGATEKAVPRKPKALTWEVNAVQGDMISPMTEEEEIKAIRDRLTALNTKAYYLLVALSFLYYKEGATAAILSCWLKTALVLTASVAAVPV